MAVQAPQIVIPGQNLGPVSRYIPGPGTHIHNSQLFASISGVFTSSLAPATSPTSSSSPAPSAKASKSNPSAARPILSVTRPSPSESAAFTNSQSATTILPDVNAIVLARVTRINPRQATVAILVVGDQVCGEGDEFQGIVRVQDVRATEKDKVRIFSSFRPGDIVRAQVISLGDQQNYYLSTARNELGVIMARSEGGETMYPVSWKEFRDPVTGAGEARKVAKPF